MMTLSPPQKNGSAAAMVTADWLQTSVQKFFTSINWDNHSPEVQQRRSEPGVTPLNLTLSVQEFFAAVNWDGSAIGLAPSSPPIALPSTSVNDFTLDAFSDLF